MPVISIGGILFFLVIVLTGCTAAPEESPRYTSGFMAVLPGYASVCIYRLENEATWVAQHVFVDGAPVFKAGHQHFTVIQLREGPHQITVKAGGLSDQEDIHLDVSAKSGEQHFYKLKGYTKRVGWREYSNTNTIKRQQEPAAEQELLRCCRYAQPAKPRYD